MKIAIARIETMKRRCEAAEALRRCTLMLPKEDDGICEYYKKDFRTLAEALRGKIYIRRYDRSIRRFFEEDFDITPRPTEQQLRSLKQEVEHLYKRCDENTAIRYKLIVEKAVMFGAPRKDAKR
ncbi:hypothetical protein NE579_07440 [Intestinimonas massiliensis]|uniref:Uncharacterized protein n=1 Tax=Intestinimonas massiliensis (ex Afouda et al. 2020) TaxID=1673721 RepID=A0AAW5JQX2_9FIRM|nr:hypothetical protein [Intestinimonas massiliensis (ex Afouda et al. 2020)]MCQ4770294.1 hypothetical protein [Intestinimonas massiliensis (ex Afouda et al. 2020)]